jgi:hypothetical protein
MFKLLKISLGFLFPLAFAFLVQAATPLDVVINEIAWMGSKISYNDEWIELFNNSSSSIDVSGWALSSEDKKIDISLVGEIQAYSFFLLERTDDDSVLTITADQIYTGSLGNDGENLILCDKQGHKIDEINCQQGWFAGDNSIKQTMERVFSSLEAENAEWQTSKNSGGTPKETNSLFAIDGEEKIPNQETDQNLLQKTYPKKIFLNELLPSPEGPDSENEWIELSNQNDFAVDISGWKLSDIIGTTKTYSFPDQTIIQANGFLVFQRTETNITLNNSGDTINFLFPDNTIIETVSYEKAKREESYSKNTLGVWEWSPNPSPGKINNINAPIPLEEKPTPEAENPDILEKNKQNIATISSQELKENISPSIFLPALATALLSTTIILFLKGRISSNSKQNPLLK